MASRRPEQRLRVPVVQQQWRNMAFLHWSFPPEEVDRLLPPGLLLDTFEEKAWVGLTLFEVHDFRTLPLPSLPGVSSYPETNLRTYVRTKDGADGIWFFSLEVDSIATVTAARSTLSVPYRWSKMSVDDHHYVSRRRSSPLLGHDVTVTPGAPIAEDDLTELDVWLTGRWRAFTRPAGRLVTIGVHHEPWPLHRCEVDDLEEYLLGHAGLDRDGSWPEHVLWSPGVKATLGFA